MFLQGERKAENQEETHADTFRECVKLCTNRQTKDREVVG